MKLRNLLFFCVFISKLLANHANTDGFEKASVEDVNVITGDYHFTLNKLEVKGAIPLRYYISYLSNNASHENAGWYHFDHLVLFYSSDPRPTIYFYEANGSLLKFTKKDQKAKKELSGWYKLVEGVEIAGMTNDPAKDFSGRANKKNYEIKAGKKTVTVYCPNGNVRRYSLVDSVLNALRHFGLPTHMNYILDWERTPEGHYTFYDFDSKGFIKRIKTTDITHEKVYSSFQWDRKKENKKNDFEIRISSSDNKLIFYKSKMMKVSDRQYRLILPKEFYGDYLIPETINYYNEKDKVGPRVSERVLPNHRKIKIEYYKLGDNWLFDRNEHIKDKTDPRLYRVKALYAPIGDKCDYYITHQFFYEPGKIGKSGGKTSVIDANGNLTVYKYSCFLRLTSIEYFKNENNIQVLQSKETFVWGEENTKNETYLTCHAFYNQDNLCVKALQYQYDIYGNVIKETIFGNITGGCLKEITFDENKLPIREGLEEICIKREFSQDGKNLILSEEKNGKITKFCYDPKTFQLISKITLKNKKILLRNFFYYDADNFLIRESTDDGTSYEESNLKGVSHRFIKKSQRYSSGNLIGMPFVIEEKYLNLTSLKECLIKKICLSYNNQKEVIQEDIYDANDVYCYSYKYSYDSNGLLISKTDPLNATISFKHDQNFNCIEKVSPKLTTTFQYNYLNQLVLKNEYDNYDNAHSTRFKYDRQCHLLEETDYLGNKTTYKNTLQGKPLTTVLPEIITPDNEIIKPIIHCEYDIFGNKTVLIDPKGNELKTAYTAENKPYLIRYQDGSAQKYEYDLDCKLKTEINQIGVKIDYIYDDLDRGISKTIIASSGEIISQETKEYNAFNLLKEIDAEGFITKYFYRADGKVIERLREGESTSYFYDSLGKMIITKENGISSVQKIDYLDQVVEEQVKNETGKLQYLKQYEYDENGNQKAVISFIEDQASKEEFIYDGYNRIKQHFNQAGNPTNYTYTIQQNAHGSNLLKTFIEDPTNTIKVTTSDSFKRLIATKTLDKSGNTLAYFEQFYDLTGNLNKRIDHVFNNPNISKEITIWEYDELNRLIKNTAAFGTCNERTVKYSYTKNNLLEKTIKPDGIELIQAYNELNQLIEQKSSDHSIHYQYHYNLLGYLIQSDDLIQNTTTKRSVDHLGRVLKETFANNLFIENKYDLNGKRLSQKFFDNTSIEYKYDGIFLKELTRNNQLKSYTHTFARYDLDKNLQEEIPCGNFKASSFTRNIFGTLSKINSAFYLQEVLEIDPEGKIISQKQQTLFKNIENNYRYDGLKQLIHEDGEYSNDYEYDSLFNRISKNNKTFKTNTLNQITSSPSATYKYAQNGNLTQINDNIFLEYDALDRLITYISDKTKVTYTYDSFNRRMTKRIFKNNSCEKIENYFYDNQNEIGSTDLNQNILQLRVLSDIENAERGSAVLLELNNKVYLPVHDIFANLIQIISLDSGEVFESYFFDSFGQAKIFDENNNPKQTSENPWRFSSKRTDDETSFVYFGRRYYSAKLGRWVTQDPKGYADGILNLYAYVLNDPLNHFDLYGLMCWSEAFKKGFQLEYDENFNCPIMEKTIETNFKFYPANDPNFDHKAFKYSGRENYTKSEWISRNENSDLLHIIINGIGAPLKGARKNGHYLNGLSNKKINLLLLYNPTHGYVTDMMEVRMNVNGNSTTPCLVLKDLISNHLASNSRAFVKLVAHSHGCAIGNNSIRKLSESEKKRVDALFVAPARILPDGIINDARNIACRFDIIPKIFNTPDERTENLKYVSWKWDHHFQSKAFEESLRKFINE